MVEILAVKRCLMENCVKLEGKKRLFKNKVIKTVVNCFVILSAWFFFCSGE